MAATTSTPASSVPAAADETTDLSRQYETPLGLAHTTMQALKDRIKLHYDLASDYYVSLWGEHIHHGYWPTEASKAADSKEMAQANLIQLLLASSGLEKKDETASAQVSADAAAAAAAAAATSAAGSAAGPAAGLTVLDVGCGVGGTSRYLARHLGCRVTGITISTRQVELATRLAKGVAETEAAKTAGAGAGAGADAGANATGFLLVGEGAVRFLELDAEKMGDYFANDAGAFDVVWISEALSHFPDKALFFRNALRVLRPGGRLVLADWFKADGLDAAAFDRDIKPIEDGMLLPPLCTQAEYVQLATDAGLRVYAAPNDISAHVSKTWDLTWALIQNPALWAFALSQGRDGIAFLQAFRAMRRGYASGTFRYAVMCFEKSL